MPYHQTITKENIHMEYYAENEEEVKLTVALKNGNIYIKSDKRIEVAGEDEGLELIDDHYKKMSKEILS